MADKRKELDFAAFPPGTVTEFTTVVCLACIFDIFTKQFGMAPRRAYSEIRNYAPTIAELTSRKAVRPFFDTDEKNAHCPYCDAASRWQSRLDTFCLEGIKSVDAVRRAFIKNLPKQNEQFKVLQIKSDRRSAFFDWLDTLRVKVDVGKDDWLIEATKAWLARREPKTDWTKIFEGVRAVRKSSKLADGWEKSGPRLYITPDLYNEILLVQIST